MSTKQKLVMAVVAILFTILAMTIFPSFRSNGVALLIGLELGIAYIPQIIEVVKTRTARGLNIDFIIILNVALTTALMNSIFVLATTGIWGYMLIEIINESLALLVLGLILYYGQGEPKKRS